MEEAFCRQEVGFYYSDAYLPSLPPLLSSCAGRGRIPTISLLTPMLFTPPHATATLSSPPAYLGDVMLLCLGKVGQEKKEGGGGGWAQAGTKWPLSPACLLLLLLPLGRRRGGLGGGDTGRYYACLPACLFLPPLPTYLPCLACLLFSPSFSVSPREVFGHGAAGGEEEEEGGRSGGLSCFWPELLLRQHARLVSTHFGT